MYFNKRSVYSIRAQANCQKRGGTEFRSDRQVNQTQVRRNHDRRVSL